MNDRLVILTLRLVHVVSGVLWVGAAAMLVGFVLPAVRDSSNGMRYLRQLIWERRLPRYLNIVLGLTLLSGVALYTNVAVLTRGSWMRSRVGITLGLGGMAALIAAAIATVGPVDRENVRLMLVISEREGGDDAGLEFRHEGRSNHQ